MAFPSVPSFDTFDSGLVSKQQQQQPHDRHQTGMEREKNMFDIDFESLYGELGKGSGDRNGMGVNGDFDLGIDNYSTSISGSDPVPGSQHTQQVGNNEFEDLFSKFFDSSKVDDQFSNILSTNNGGASALAYSSAFSSVNSTSPVFDPLSSGNNAPFDFTSTAPIFDFDFNMNGTFPPSGSLGTLSSPDDDLLVTPPQIMQGFSSPHEGDIPTGDFFPPPPTAMPMKSFERAFEMKSEVQAFKSVPLPGTVMSTSSVVGNGNVGRRSVRRHTVTRSPVSATQDEFAIEPALLSGTSASNSPVESPSPVDYQTSLPPRRTSTARSTTIERATSVLPNFQTSVPLHVRTPINLDAPTQPRMYITSSSTSRKEIPAFVEKQLARKKFQKRQITTDTLRAAASGTADLPASEAALPKKILESIEKKRMQNTMAARRSRLRREEQLRALEEEVLRLREEGLEWKTRYDVARRCLERCGRQQWVKDNE
ncbi:hypothetical protein BT69DRAFT_1277067 [Atractiella rhizophila]|nr:hypothetical protein BT69DRAFT_1277067 [Atractiella rhizophila]